MLINFNRMLDLGGEGSNAMSSKLIDLKSNKLELNGLQREVVLE